MAKARRSNTGLPNAVDSADDSSATTTNSRGDDGIRSGGYSSDQIAARAYELYLARGAADGQDFDDWITAERELSTSRSHAEDRTVPPPGERSE